MLTPAELERAPVAYRKGYMDGYYGVDRAPSKVVDGAGYHAKPFASGDYENGHRAGANDALWDERLREPDGSK